MNKQDEEKAKSLWYHFCTEESCDRYKDCKLCPKAQAHPQLLEIATWKEQQMIEKVSLFFIDAFKELPNGYGTFKIKRDGSIEQLIEDFKKSIMEE